MDWQQILVSMNQAQSLTLAVQKVLAKETLHLHRFLVYRLTKNLELPVSALLHDKVFGQLTKDPALLVSVLSTMPFVRFPREGWIKLSYKNSLRRVLVTGLEQSVVQRYLLGYDKNYYLTVEPFCLSILCESWDDAERLCLYLRDCKKESERGQEKIKPNEYRKIRICIEALRLHSLLLEVVARDRQLQFQQSFLRAREGVVARPVMEHYEEIYRRMQLTTGSSTKPDEEESNPEDDPINDEQQKRLQTHTQGEPEGELQDAVWWGEAEPDLTTETVALCAEKGPPQDCKKPKHSNWHKTKLVLR